MTTEFNPSEEVNYTQAQARIDLLEALLEPDEPPYPWNTADPDSEAYFVEREQDFLLEYGSIEETASSHFFTQLEQMWCSTTSAANNSAASAPMQTTLPPQEAYPPASKDILESE